MHKFIILTSLSLLLSSAFSCGLPAGGGSSAQSSRPRDVTAAPTDSVRSAVKSQRTFGLALYRDVANSERGNLFLSPYSIGVALSMTSAGARGTTAAAFTSTLGIELQPEAWHQAINDLERQLNSRGQTATTATPFKLSTANRLYAQADLSFVPAFLDTLAGQYGADVGLVDFVRQLEPARQTINRWVDDRTQHRIPELLQKGMISESTRLVLVNAIYFRAAWAKQFLAVNTAPAAFLTSATASKMVPFMHGEVRVRATQLHGVEVVELPYDGDQLSLVVLMPAQGELANLEASLTAATFDELRAAATPETIELSMPRFEIRSPLLLRSHLEGVGLGVAFSSGADFSGLSNETLNISEVVQQAFVTVNETGTEAAAATAVIFTRDGGILGYPQVPRRVDLNRPFVFAIVDRATQALVFMGRVTEP